MKSTWEGLLDSFFLDFTGFRDPSWAWKSGQDRTRQDRTGQDRTGQDKTRQDKDKDKTRQDFDRQREAVDERRGGEGFAPLLGGYSPGARILGVTGSWGLLLWLFCYFVALNFFIVFRCVFASIFNRFSTPTWLPKSIKIDQTSVPRCLPMLTSFFRSTFDRFLLPTWTPRIPKIFKMFFLFIYLFDFRCLPDKIHIGLQLGANTAPFWFPKSSKTLPPKRHKLFDRF